MHCAVTVTRSPGTDGARWRMSTRTPTVASPGPIRCCRTQAMHGSSRSPVMKPVAKTSPRPGTRGGPVQIPDQLAGGTTKSMDSTVPSCTPTTTSGPPGRFRCRPAAFVETVTRAPSAFRRTSEKDRERPGGDSRDSPANPFQSDRMCGPVRAETGSRHGHCSAGRTLRQHILRATECYIDGDPVVHGRPRAVLLGSSSARRGVSVQQLSGCGDG